MADEPKYTDLITGEPLPLWAEHAMAKRNALPTQREVTPEDREAAWPFRPEGYGPLDKPKWDAGVYDSCRHIQSYKAHRLAHTARPDAGDDKAEIERLRGLLIDPGSPAWEDARGILVAELRKAGLDKHADGVANADGSYIPSHIALNLIAQAARRPDTGDEDVERVARAIYESDVAPIMQDWEQEDRYVHERCKHLARAALAAMREGVDRGMVERAKEIEEAAREYFDHYLQDEADSEADCVCGAKQHLAAVRLRDALSPEQPR